VGGDRRWSDLSPAAVRQASHGVVGGLRSSASDHIEHPKPGTLVCGQGGWTRAGPRRRGCHRVDQLVPHLGSAPEHPECRAARASGHASVRLPEHEAARVSGCACIRLRMHQAACAPGCFAFGGGVRVVAVVGPVGEVWPTHGGLVWAGLCVAGCVAAPPSTGRSGSVRRRRRLGVRLPWVLGVGRLVVEVVAPGARIGAVGAAGWGRPRPVWWRRGGR
jgi:hypothetical protein